MAKYDLYVGGDCISEHNKFETAERAFQKAVSDYPDMDIDILSPDGETSYMSYDSETQEIYNNETHL